MRTIFVAACILSVAANGQQLTKEEQAQIHRQLKEQEQKDKAAAKRDKKAKPSKQPTQQPITSGCVSVVDIYSHKLGLWSGIVSRRPGLEGVIQNDCAAPMSVFLNIGYFGNGDVQFGDGILSATVAPGARYAFYHEAYVSGIDAGAMLKMAKVIAIHAYSQ